MTGTHGSRPAKRVVPCYSQTRKGVDRHRPSWLGGRERDLDSSRFHRFLADQTLSIETRKDTRRPVARPVVTETRLSACDLVLWCMRPTGETSALSTMSMLRTLRIGAKSVDRECSRSNRSMASLSRIGCQKRAKTPKPLGPISMIVPTGESTTTCPAWSRRVRIPGASSRTRSGEIFTSRPAMSELVPTALANAALMVGGMPYGLCCWSRSRRTFSEPLERSSCWSLATGSHDEPRISRCKQPSNFHGRSSSDAPGHHRIMGKSRAARASTAHRSIHRVRQKARYRRSCARGQ